MSGGHGPLPRQSDDGRYRLGEPLGRGALATVVALEGPDGRAFAGKILHASHGDDPGAAARFLQEAALLRRLDHPSVVRAHDIVAVAGRTMLVLERVDGPTLAQRIARAAPLGEPDLIAIGRSIAAGLAHAHARGLIHRVLKPSNSLLAPPAQPGAPPLAKIADFGMARASSLAGVERGGLAAVGTPDYMAPEHLDPLAVDPRSDLYSLGCILFEAATGRPPYGAATPSASSTSPAPPPSRLSPIASRSASRSSSAPSSPSRPPTAPKPPRSSSPASTTSPILTAPRPSPRSPATAAPPAPPAASASSLASPSASPAASRPSPSAPAAPP